MDVLAEVLQEFPQRNVRIVNKENAGLPKARQSGLELATGEYVMNVDADDWIEPDAVEKLVAEALRTGADLVYCDFWKEYGAHSKLDHEKHYSVETKDKWMNRLYNDGAYGFVWCKFCKRSLYEHIFVPSYNMHEDIVFSTQLIWRAFRLSTIAARTLPLPPAWRATSGVCSRPAISWTSVRTAERRSLSFVRAS